MNTLNIIRGLPGSGKTTYAKTHFPLIKHFEADMFFSRDGEYKFDPTKLNAAHTWCRNQVEKSMRDRKDVVVSNTFIQEWEFDKYIGLAENYNYAIHVIELKTQFQNVHGVPLEKIEIMKNKWTPWDDMADQWKHLNIKHEVVI